MLTSTQSKDSRFAGIEDGIALAHAIVDTVRDPLVVLDYDLRVVAASRSFFSSFPAGSRGCPPAPALRDRWRSVEYPRVARSLETISNGQAHWSKDTRSTARFPRIGRRATLLNARKVFYEKGTHTSVLLAFEDITWPRLFTIGAGVAAGKETCNLQKHVFFPQQLLHLLFNRAPPGNVLERKEHTCMGAFFVKHLARIKQHDATPDRGKRASTSYPSTVAWPFDMVSKDLATRGYSTDRHRSRKAGARGHPREPAGKVLKKDRLAATTWRS